jgi:hypothetical protein
MVGLMQRLSERDKKIGCREEKVREEVNLGSEGNEINARRVREYWEQ